MKRGIQRLKDPASVDTTLFILSNANTFFINTILQVRLPSSVRTHVLIPPSAPRHPRVLRHHHHQPRRLFVRQPTQPRPWSARRPRRPASRMPSRMRGKHVQRYVTPPDPLPDFPPYRQAKNSRATSTLNVDPTIQNSTGSSTLATAPTTFAQSCVSGGTFYVFFSSRSVRLTLHPQPRRRPLPPPSRPRMQHRRRTRQGPSIPPSVYRRILVRRVGSRGKA